MFKHAASLCFGLEGGESLIPSVKTLIDCSVEHGIGSITIGTPHQGRLNVLANIIRRPIVGILHRFTGKEDDGEGSGDVKYHLGANYMRPMPSGKKVALSLVANLSHLEAEDLVVLGKTRALQDFAGNKEHETLMALLMHETMGMYNLPNYATGGTIHIVVNNQIGFTTDLHFSCSMPYPLDNAKSIDAPIFHVNSDDVEAVAFVAQLAADWHAKFKKDIIIDLVCYRHHSHNETDQPLFTQPRMYDAIAKQEPTLKKYVQCLVEEGSFTQSDINKHQMWVWGMLEEVAEKSKSYQPEEREWLSSTWEGFPSPKELAEKILDHKDTGIDLVDLKTLKHIGKVVLLYPKDFSIHKNLGRILKTRGKMVEEGKNIDMSTAKVLAFGLLHDQVDKCTYTLLQHIDEKQVPFVACNLLLSKFGCMGFEPGFSLVDPKNLTIWEAQFGDFANNVQCIIDQFIALGERKWLQCTGLMLNLPRGYNGQGPEHSSTCIECFLQLCDDHPFRFPTAKKNNRQHQDSNS
ncbi:2-oxoglutarate dehydrogenase E1 component [Thecaphora frezii]